MSHQVGRGFLGEPSRVCVPKDDKLRGSNRKHDRHPVLTTPRAKRKWAGIARSSMGANGIDVFGPEFVI
jgi:hypothetical protein